MLSVEGLKNVEEKVSAVKEFENDETDSFVLNRSKRTGTLQNTTMQNTTATLQLHSLVQSKQQQKKPPGKRRTPSGRTPSETGGNACRICLVISILTTTVLGIAGASVYALIVRKLIFVGENSGGIFQPDSAGLADRDPMDDYDYQEDDNEGESLTVRTTSNPTGGSEIRNPEIMGSKPPPSTTPLLLVPFPDKLDAFEKMKLHCEPPTKEKFLGSTNNAQCPPVDFELISHTDNNADGRIGGRKKKKKEIQPPLPSEEDVGRDPICTIGVEPIFYDIRLTFGGEKDGRNAYTGQETMVIRSPKPCQSSLRSCPLGPPSQNQKSPTLTINFDTKSLKSDSGAGGNGNMFRLTERCTGRQICLKRARIFKQHAAIRFELAEPMMPGVYYNFDIHGFHGSKSHGFFSVAGDRGQATEASSPLPPFIGTQFPLRRARSVFPCLDHPSLKAVFRLRVDHCWGTEKYRIASVSKPTDLSRLENVDDAEDGEDKSEAAEEDPRRKSVLFDPTPPISPHSFAFAFIPRAAVGSGSGGSGMFAVQMNEYKSEMTIGDGQIAAAAGSNQRMTKISSFYQRSSTATDESGTSSATIVSLLPPPNPAASSNEQNAGKPPEKINKLAAKTRNQQIINIAKTTLKQMEQVTKLTYPVRKLSLVGVAEDINLGGMGLIVLNQKVSDPKNAGKLGPKIIQQKIIEQWIGNIVTIRYWSEACLLEGLSAFLSIHFTVEPLVINTEIQYLRYHALSHNWKGPLLTEINEPKDVTGVCAYRAPIFYATLARNFDIRNLVAYLVERYAYGSVGLPHFVDAIEQTTNDSDSGRILKSHFNQFGVLVLVASMQEQQEERTKTENPPLRPSTSTTSDAAAAAAVVDHYRSMTIRIRQKFYEFNRDDMPSAGTIIKAPKILSEHPPVSIALEIDLSNRESIILYMTDDVAYQKELSLPKFDNKRRRPSPKSESESEPPQANVAGGGDWLLVDPKGVSMYRTLYHLDNYLALFRCYSSRSSGLPTTEDERDDKKNVEASSTQEKQEEGVEASLSKCKDNFRLRHVYLDFCYGLHRNMMPAVSDPRKQTESDRKGWARLFMALLRFAGDLIKSHRKSAVATERYIMPEIVLVFFCGAEKCQGTCRCCLWPLKYLDAQPSAADSVCTRERWNRDCAGLKLIKFLGRSEDTAQDKAPVVGFMDET